MTLEYGIVVTHGMASSACVVTAPAFMDQPTLWASLAASALKGLTGLGRLRALAIYALNSEEERAAWTRMLSKRSIAQASPKSLSEGI